MSIVPDVGYVPLPHCVVMELLALAQIRPHDKLIDLGSGDGRIVVAAAAAYQAEAIGYECQADLAAESRKLAEWFGVRELVTILEEDLRSADTTKATVLVAFLHPDLSRLIISLARQATRNCRVLTARYPLPGLTPSKVAVVRQRPHQECELFRYDSPFG